MPSSLSSRRRFIAAGASLAAAGAAGSAARAAQFEFKCGSELAVDHPAIVRLTQMWASIEQESGGRIKTQMFPNSILGSQGSMFSQMRVGAMQFQFLNPGNLSTLVPAANIVNLGFAFKDQDDALRAMDGKLGEFVRQETAAKGLYLFRTMWDGGMYQIGSVGRAVKTPEDLRGFKIRVAQSKIAVDLFKELGANPSPLSFEEVYTGLQTRLIDGEAAPLVVIETSRFFEVQKFVSLSNHAWVGEWLCANGEVWKSLPPDLVDIVERNHTRYALLGRKDTKASEAQLVSRLRGHGLAVNQVDQTPFRARLHTYYDTWSSAFGPTQWGLLQTSIGRRLN